MFTPLSLRLCCMAAMAPALTDTAGQARIQLTGSPPPQPVDTTTSQLHSGLPGKEINQKYTNGFDVASEKGTEKNPVLTLTSGLQKGTRGLLRPIQGNGTLQSLYARGVNSLKLQKNWKELGIIPHLPNFLKNIAFTAQSVTCQNHVDHQYNKAGSVRKMNHTSNDNGPNGTGKRFTKQNILDGKSVNGHTNNHAKYSKKIQYNRSSSLVAKQRRASTEPDRINPTMCRTTELESSSCQAPKMTTPGTSTGETDPRNMANRHLLQRSSVNVEETTNRTTPESGGARPMDPLKETVRRQVLLEKRSQFLLRRLRRLQGKHLESHVKSQLGSFVNFQHKNLQSVATKAIGPIGSESENILFQNYDIKNLSTSALVSLVRKLQLPQSKLPLEHHLANKKKKTETRGVLAMDPSTSAESARKSAHLQTNVSHWLSNVDSDATESSSGGESCDEDEDRTRDQTVPPLYKRAQWKWVVDRAAIVSRWTWLQAQVSDLEYRIRQQSDIHKTIRASKGVVTLGEPPQPTILGRISSAGDAGSLGFNKAPEVSPCNISTLLNNVNRQATKLTQSLGGCFSPITNSNIAGDKTKSRIPPRPLNGFVDGSHTNVTSTPHASGSLDARKTPVNRGASGDFHSAILESPDLSQMLDATCHAARCRPLLSARKRKLLRTAGLHQVSHKAARLSSVKCQCYQPVMSCPMCGGRYNNFQRLDAEGMPITEKVSLLDPAYHPVLSFPQEIPLPVHFEALLKSGEWQSAKPPPKLSLKAIAAEKRRQKLLAASLKDQNRKNRKKLAKNAAAVLLTSAKLRSKYESKSPRGTPTKKKVTAETRLRRKELKRRRAAQLAITALSNSRAIIPAAELDQDSVSTRSTTPTPSPQMRGDTLSGSCSSSMLKDMKAEAALRKKKFENAYDINNIVIPYSMAASTRVEKIQYKEIQTPKWRDLSLETEAEPGTDVEMADSGEVEDMSDEAFDKRHSEPEMSERKRFRSFITYPPARRSRMSRESESHSSLDALSPDLTAGDAYFQSIVANETQSLHSSAAYSGRDEYRRRSGSASSKRPSIDELGREYFCESLDRFREPVEPWVARTFPLEEDYYAEIKREQAESIPIAQIFRTRAEAVKMEEDIEFGNAMCGRPTSPMEPPSPAPSSSSGSLIEDLDDPEWHASRPRKMHRSKR